MVAIEKYKIIFGDVEYKYVKSIFHTFIAYMDIALGENEKYTEEQKFHFLQQAKYCSQLEYDDYRHSNPDDINARVLYLKYQHWIDSFLNSFTYFKKKKKSEKESCFESRDELLILFNSFKDTGIFHKETQQKDFSIFLNASFNFSIDKTNQAFSNLKNLTKKQLKEKKLALINELNNVIIFLKKDTV